MPRKMSRSQLHTLREVWAAYSRRPGASIRDVMAATGYTLNMVARHRRLLKEFGYLDFPPGQYGARATTVIIPIVTLGDGVRVSETGG